MNKVLIAGRLTRDPEIRYSQSANPVAVVRFGVAVNRRFKREGEPDADFINCVAFGKSGEFISKYFKKGMMIGITGTLRVNSWTDNNSQKRITTEVFVEEAEFLESKNSFQSNTQSNYNNSQQAQKPINNTQNNNTEPDDFYSIESSVDDDDNLPF